MSVSHILNLKGGDVLTVEPLTPLADVSRLLTEKRIGAVVVVEGEKILGILSERDLVHAVARDGAAALGRPARDCMTSKVTTCGRETGINELMEVMTRGRFRHLPVVENGRLAGIVSIGDVVKARIAEIQHEADQIRDYIATA
ncbi:CBS domain-containing protein [Faunimonas pinastri]|uniref:CBS domain-containing protein n=1 Tax=Faunimonas pinastri TaxID=1855383 RepID=A0A1H9DAJ3_9HYPH|nr:CBS domain-containing protein [Faunimonas pinastri]SEQ10510.1 CBS domain-containing protein [Faunimonas pinastri]